MILSGYNLINQANKIQKFLLQHIPKHPNDIVSMSMSHFKVSRTTVLRHINHLVNQNKISRSGKTRQIIYTLNSSFNKHLLIKLSTNFDEFDFFTEHFRTFLLNNINKRSYDICEYVITELLNNCKDHSQGNKVEVITKMHNGNFCCSIIDNGIGIFKKLSDCFSLTDLRDVIFELSKGKLTSDPANHTGEGIFFSSRSVDRFTINANGHQFYRDNIEHDWTFVETNKSIGTSINFEINKQSDRQLEKLFKQYTDDVAFTKTEILVDLSKHIGDRLISRSQAKRACQRLENFTNVTLDFNKVESVGQGFVDQIFRVYQTQKPNLIINYINANTSVEYMIKRCLNSTKIK